MISSKIEVVLLDFGGVIAHLADPEVAAELERSLGLEESELRTMMYNCPQWDAIASGQLLEEEYWRILGGRLHRDPAELQHILRPLWEPSGMNEAVVALAQALRPSVRVAVLSNWTLTLEDHIESMGITHLFDPIINSARVGTRKPDEAIFLHAIEVLGVPAQTILFVDDSPRNIEAAGLLGLQAVLFESAEQLAQDLDRYGVLSAPEPAS